MIDVILPVIARLLEDERTEVRQAAANALITVSSFISEEDIGTSVLTIVLHLAHEDEKEELRMLASELFNSLAENFGSELCKQFVVPEVICLSEDPVFRVRKSVALNFHNICKIGDNHELNERLIPAFVKLSQDNMYRVRKACAESLSDISTSIKDNDIKNGVLVPIFLSLAQDPSKAVKQSALQQLGRFITTLAIKENMRQMVTMITHFNSMVHDPTGDPAIDADLKYYCAYHFPGVLQSVGAERWPQLKEVFKVLAASKILVVQQTVAFSLHEVSRLVCFGPTSAVDDDIVSIFEDMIQDVETVQSAVIKYIASFLETLPQSTRVSYLPLLHDILHSTNPFNWRLRQCLALQLSKLALLPPVEGLYESLFPLAMTLLQDPVSCVRKESYSGIAKMIQILFDYSCKYPDDQVVKKHLQLIATAINSLASGETYQMRQLWIELFLRFLLDLDRLVIESYFINILANLASDPVCNVRVSFASLLSSWSKLEAFSRKEITRIEDLEPTNWAWLLGRPDIVEVIAILASDDVDVHSYMVHLKPLFPNLTFSVIIKTSVPEKPIATSSSISNISISIPVPKKSDISDTASPLSDNFVFDLPNIDGLPDEILNLERAERGELAEPIDSGDVVLDNVEGESKVD